jgi:hypothetical protein
MVMQGLTFQEALKSEHAASMKLSKFPETHVEAVLRMVHHGRFTLDAAPLLVCALLEYIAMQLRAGRSS